MGFTDATTAFAAKSAQADPERLVPYGGVPPRFTKDPAGDVDRLVDLGIRLVKIHPPHQGMPANAYTNGLEALGNIYRRGGERAPPGVSPTRTSHFSPARAQYRHPQELRGVAVGFSHLRRRMAH